MFFFSFLFLLNAYISEDNQGEIQLATGPLILNIDTQNNYRLLCLNFSLFCVQFW